MARKGQMEIMGLAIVVVLLVLGMMFALRFMIFRPQTTHRKDYTNTQLAANMLNTLLNTNTLCNKISVSELLQDASKTNPDITNCPGTSLDFVNDTIYNITVATLKDRWKKDYYFKASVPSKVVVEAGKEQQSRERERKTHFLSTDSGVMTLILDVYS